jgi:hypothetical protein
MAPVGKNSTSTITLEKKRSLSPEETTEEVRVVSIAEYEHAAMSLAEAFAVDEVARYFLDTDDMESYTEEYKYKLHCDIMRYVTAAHCYKGIVTTIGPNYDAVALWYVPLSVFSILESDCYGRLMYEQDATRQEHGRPLDHSPLRHVAPLVQALLGRQDPVLQRVPASPTRHQA